MIGDDQAWAGSHLVERPTIPSLEQVLFMLRGWLWIAPWSAWVKPAPPCLESSSLHHQQGYGWRC
jgi:hypothetical protein